MKKNFKKILTTALASVMALGAVICFDQTTVKADGGEYDAYLGFTDNDWAFGNWDAAKASTKVTGDGSYTVTLNAADVGGDGTKGANGAQVFYVDINGACTDLAAAGKTYELTELKITADGAEVAVDMSKVVTGDLEEKGNYRIEIFNVYGTTKDNSPIGDAAAFTFKDTLTVDFTIKTVDAAGGDGTGEEPPASDTPAAFDPAGSYNAYLGLQTPHWTYRDAWNAENGIGSEVWGQFIYNNDSGEKYGTVTDTVVAGNGTYTVSIKDFGTVFADDFAAEGKEIFNLLYVSTDIPLSDDIKVSDVKLIIDGSVKHTDATAYLDPDETEYVKILIQNIWNENKSEISYYPAPAESLEMQFTISGFNYDKAADEPAEDDTTAADSNAGANNATDASADTSEDKADDEGSILPIVIAVVAVVVVAAVVVVVMKKKKAN